VIREPVQRPDKVSTPRSFSWSTSAIAVGEAILAHEDRPLRVAKLAKESDWTAAQTARHSTTRAGPSSTALRVDPARTGGWSTRVAELPSRQLIPALSTAPSDSKMSRS